MCVCIYVCIYVCINVCIYMCVYICVYIYVCIHVCVYMCVYICVYICVYMCVYIYVCVHICVHISRLERRRVHLSYLAPISPRRRRPVAQLRRVERIDQLAHHRLLPLQILQKQELRGEIKKQE